MTVTDSRLYHAAAVERIRARNVDVIEEPTSNPPSTNRWCVVYGPTMTDDQADENMCGIPEGTLITINVICAGKTFQHAGWVADQVCQALMMSRLTPEADPLARTGGRPISPEPGNPGVWSGAIVFQATT